MGPNLLQTENWWIIIFPLLWLIDQVYNYINKYNLLLKNNVQMFTKIPRFTGVEFIW